jgi:hypothetical protein
MPQTNSKVLFECGDIAKQDREVCVDVAMIFKNKQNAFSIKSTKFVCIVCFLLCVIFVFFDERREREREGRKEKVNLFLSILLEDNFRS